MADSDPILVEVPTEWRGPRVLLRPFAETDAAAVWHAIEESRALLTPWMPWTPGQRSEADSLRYIRQCISHWAVRDDLALGIFDAASGNFIGGTGLHRIDWRIRRFEIGYWIRASQEGQGLVTESVQVLTRAAFRDLAAARVEIRMDVRNTRSRNVPQRLGFVHEGCLRQALPDVHGEPRDIDVFSLVRDDLSRLEWARLS